ncbi:BT_3987 domain-containing protein [Sphingobacterium spiritivorum]|uniref:BT_3987 domain-containing protein n=1 Tax=Sphingobacterium spiritivorum TaxID=258 RepID=UPI003DA45964
MKMHTTLYRISMILLVFGLFACSKEEIASKELLAYIKADGSPHEATIAFNRTPISTSGATSAQFTAYLTREAKKDVVFSVQTEPSLVEQYNKQNKTSFDILPATNYELSGINGLTIKAGETVSNDSIRITLKNRQDLTNTNGYLLPLSIQTINSTEKGVTISNTHRTVYVIVSSTFNNIDQSSNKPVSGRFIDRKNPVWTIPSASAPYFSAYAAMNVLDGDVKTDYITNYGANNYINMDMNQVYQVKAIVLTPSYSFFFPLASNTVDVLTSLDNITWTEQGKYIVQDLDESSSATNPDNRNINFYGAVKARYIKLIFDKDLGSSLSGYSEINAIQ